MISALGLVEIIWFDDCAIPGTADQVVKTRVIDAIRKGDNLCDISLIVFYLMRVNRWINISVVENPAGSVTIIRAM